MKLYVCWGTWTAGDHPCGSALTALKEAGHDPAVEKTYGWRVLPDLLNPGRKEVLDLTGQKAVPVLVTDDGETVYDSRAIVEWAKAHPAP